LNSNSSQIFDFLRAHRCPTDAQHTRTQTRSRCLSGSSNTSRHLPAPQLVRERERERIPKLFHLTLPPQDFGTPKKEGRPHPQKTLPKCSQFYHAILSCLIPLECLAPASLVHVRNLSKLLAHSCYKLFLPVPNSISASWLT
jgi:hypothetical protein